MWKLTIWAVPALIVGLFAAPILADDEAPANGEAKPPARPAIRWSPWVTRMMASGAPQKPVEKKPAPKVQKQTAKKPAVPSKPAKIVDQAAVERSREEAALIRRLEVCDKLMEIAVRTDDNELLHRAEQLDERVRETYAQRTGSLASSAESFRSAVQGGDQGRRSGAKEVNR
jgi:hypothetical protein